jgi:hypothetical protein
MLRKMTWMPETNTIPRPEKQMDHGDDTQDQENQNTLQKMIPIHMPDPHLTKVPVIQSTPVQSSIHRRTAYHLRNLKRETNVVCVRPGRSNRHATLIKDLHQSHGMKKNNANKEEKEPRKIQTGQWDDPKIRAVRPAKLYHAFFRISRLSTDDTAQL